MRVLKAFSTWFIIFLVIANFLLSPVSLNAQEHKSSMDIDLVSSSVVQVVTIDGVGSGSVIKGGPLVLTNRHVVEGQTVAIISVLEDLNKPAVPKYLAEVVAFSPQYDFAVLTIVSDLDGNSVIDHDGNYIGQSFFPHIPYSSGEKILNRGDWVAVFGYPDVGVDELVFTTGIISSVKHESYKGKSLPTWYRTNAQMSSGSSGGIAVNSKGEIIGIPTYIRTGTRSGVSLGSILSIEMINAVLEAEDVLFNWEDYDKTFVSQNEVFLDFELAPYYASISLNTGFTPDPHQVSVISGGFINTEYLGGECTGYASQAPDIRLLFAGYSNTLRFFFEADDPDEDATLLVNLPDGSWLCNDDAHSGTLDPMVVINDPPEGQYDIWIGSYYADDYISGTLSISELDVSPGSSLDFTLDPNFGFVTLRRGFTPDPYVVSLISGGQTDVARVLSGQDCIGYASSAPDFRLHWAGSTQDLRIYFLADDPDDDTVLIINTPNGRWVCNDDAHGNTLNPMIDLSVFPEGQYDIWVGSYYENEHIEGRLIITERDTGP